MDDRKIKIGSIAPDFNINDQNDKEFLLSSFKGKKILLSFHPLAWTKICAEQMKSLEENYEKFEDLNTIAVGVSIDSIPSKKAWAESLKITKTSLLSDFWHHGKIAKSYDIFREKQGISERANIIIDENQRIKWLKIYEISKLPDINEVLNNLK